MFKKFDNLRYACSMARYMHGVWVNATDNPSGEILVIYNSSKASRYVVDKYIGIVEEEHFKWMMEAHPPSIYNDLGKRYMLVFYGAKINGTRYGGRYPLKFDIDEMGGFDFDGLRVHAIRGMYFAQNYDKKKQKYEYIHFEYDIPTDIKSYIEKTDFCR